MTIEAPILVVFLISMIGILTVSWIVFVALHKKLKITLPFLRSVFIGILVLTCLLLVLLIKDKVDFSLEALLPPWRPKR